MELTTNRRALLKAAPVVALTAAMPSVAAGAPTADRREWDAAMDALAKIEAEDAAFTPGWWETWQLCKAECDSVPHVTFEPEAYSGGRCQTTADVFEVNRARREVADLDAGRMYIDPLPGLREHYEIKRNLVHAADARDRHIQAIRDRFGMDDADTRAEELGDMLADAQGRVMSTPAPDLAALRAKLLRLPDEKDGSMPAWSADYVRQTFADVARLLPVEA